jgi:hypothetical protein
MANYANSNLVKAQGRLLAAFERSELRFRDPMVFKLYLEGSPIMFPNSKELRTREDRAISAYYKLRTARTLGTGRSHNHTGTKGAAGNLDPSWTTYNDVFNTSLKQADNNIYTLAEMFDNELFNVIGNFAEGLEDAAINHMFSNRSGVNTAVSEGTFNGTNDAFEINEASSGERAIQITKSMMDENKYSGEYVIVCDPIAFNKFEKDANQGSGNSTNLAFQFGGVRFVKSVELGPLATGLGYTKGFWMALPVGTVAALDWIPVQNRIGVETKENSYGQIQNPVDGLQYAIHSYETRADDTANNGYTQDVVTQYEVSIDVALENAPLSVADASTILAAALV